MPELMHPYHTEVIENQTEIDGARPNLDNAATWDEVEYLVVDRIFPQDADLVLAP